MGVAQTDVVVVGAGQAGLAAAYHLRDTELDYIVIERGRIGETWRSARWESFVLNTPNHINGLPGDPYAGKDPSGFMSHLELADSFDRYVERFELRVQQGTEVKALRSTDGPRRFAVETASTGSDTTILTDAVIVASGSQRVPRIPSFSEAVPSDVLQLTSGTYRSPAALPPGAVLVVGGGQSGAQIVEDLVGAGREVFFSISKVPRVPRRYRGRDFMEWWQDMGIWDIDVDEVEDPAMLSATNPLVSGVGPVGHSMSFQQLAATGVHLLGRASHVENGVLHTDDRVPEYIENGDEFSSSMKRKIDSYIELSGVDAPAAEFDPGDEPVDDARDIAYATQLDLSTVGTIVWSTGFRPTFDWIHLPVTDDAGRPVHTRGVSDVEGLCFIGFPWLSSRKSGVIYGVDEDARHICGAIAASAPSLTASEG